MGVEDLGSGGSGGGFVHPEMSSWLTFIWCILSSLGLEGVLLDHGSHEDIIGISREVWGDDSLVLTIGSTILDGVPGVEWLLFDWSSWASWEPIIKCDGGRKAEKAGNSKSSHIYLL